MADYRTPLPQLMAGLIEAGVNRVLALDSEAAKRLLKLQDKCLQLDLEGGDVVHGYVRYLTLPGGGHFERLRVSP